MNRLRWAVLMGLLMLFTASTAEAQYRTGRAWVIGSGIAFPMGPDAFSDLWKSGFVLNVGLRSQSECGAARTGARAGVVSSVECQL